MAASAGNYANSMQGPIAGTSAGGNSWNYDQGTFLPAGANPATWNGTGSTINSYGGGSAAPTKTYGELLGSGANLSPELANAVAPPNMGGSAFFDNPTMDINAHMRQSQTGSPSQAQPFNMNTAAVQGVQGAMAGAAQGMGFNSARQGAGYMNPYMSNVVGNLTGEAFRNYDQLNNALGAQASKAGAFGGSRHGVAQAQLGQGVMRDLNSQIGNLAYQGYSDALSNARQDQAMRLGAASQLGNTANLGFQMGRQVNQDMIMQGAMQQALQQMAMDKASGQYQGFQQSPYTALNQYASILGQIPYSTTQTQTGTAVQNRGLMDYLGMGFYGAGALGYTPFA